MAPIVSVIIVTRNRKEKLERCLRSLLDSPTPTFEVIVVDNGSTDGTAALLSTFPVQLIDAGRNLLPSAAVNLGARSAAGEFLFLVADDNVFSPHTLQAAVKCARASGASVVGPKTFFLEDPERVWSFGARFRMGTGLCRFPLAGRFDRDVERPNWEPDAVHNALLVLRSTFVDLGGFDQKEFPMHNEEADFCYRVRRAGGKILACASSHIWHDVRFGKGWGSRDYAVESEFRAYLTARNRCRLILLHGRWYEVLSFLTIFLLPTTVIYLAIIFFDSDRSKSARVRAYSAGVVDGITGRMRQHCFQ